jgi:hypothetical protein
MERIEYVPLGSVVLLKDTTQKLLVIARAINVKNGDKTYFFDYGGVLYPDGLTGDRMAYFNHDGINKVVFEGFDDVENQNVVDTINNYLEANPNVNRGDPTTWDK